MRKLLLGTLGLIAMAAPAFAADLPARTYNPPPPVVAPVLYDWTGFYIGANGGWAQSHNCVDFLPVGGVLVADACANKSGGIFAGQIGYAWGPSLLYVKGGAAVVDNNLFISDTFTGTPLATISSNTRWGASVGVGFEYLFTPNWSVGLEYDHLFMGNDNNSFSNPNAAVVLNRVNQDVDMITARFNYKFGWGGPAVARY